MLSLVIFMKLKKDNSFVAFIVPLLQNKPMQMFAHYTGADMSFGYFAPNVRSNGVVITESCGKKLMPNFNSFESRVRYHSATSKLIDDAINKRDTTAANKSELISETDYNNLIYKNIAIKLMNESDCTADSVMISYNFIILPSLAEKRENSNSPMALLKYKELTFSLHNRLKK